MVRRHLMLADARGSIRHATSLVGVALVLAAGVAVPSPAAAAVLAVDSTADAADAVPGDGVCATASGACTLRAAIEEANATPGGDAIVLPPGDYGLDLGELPVSRNLSVVGTSDDPGTGADERPVVNAGGGSRAFRVDGVGDTSIEVQLSDVVIKGGEAGAGDGGGILNVAGHLTLRDVLLTGNRADDGGGLYNDRGTLDLADVVLHANLASGNGDGAGIYNILGDLAWSRGVATFNIADGDGGGIFTDRGDLSLRDVELRRNLATTGSGGGLHDAMASSIELTDTDVVDNDAGGDGGGIFTNEGHLTASGGTVEDNTAGASGGGIHNEHNATVTLSDLSVSDNLAEVGDGGGIHHAFGTLTMEDVAVDDNEARDPAGGGIAEGGGIFNDSGALSVTGGSVDRNRAEKGGGISSRDFDGTHASASVTVTGASVSHNRAVGGPGAGNGGGIFNGGGIMDIVVVDTAVDANTAGSEGGGIYHRGRGSLVLREGSSVSGNASLGEGGGIEVDGDAVLRILESAVNDNVSTGTDNGGGIDMDGETLVVRGSEISGNSSPRDGGGIQHEGDGPLVVVDSTISDNDARMDGGGIKVARGDHARIVGSVISGNSAARDGGGINSGEPLRLRESSVEGNEAGEEGGGIFLSHSPQDAVIEDSTISGNVAGTDGGGVFVNAFDINVLTVHRSTVRGNIALDEGGGIYSAGTLDVANSTISANTSVLDGGGIYSASPLTVFHSTITANLIINDGAGDGSGIYTSGEADLEGSIVAHNDLDNCFNDGGALNTGGNNLEDVPDPEADPGTCQLDDGGPGVPRDLLVTDAMLDVLAPNGGPTDTHALLDGSLAIDAAKGEGCPPPETDQRGEPRPAGGTCDIGSFERTLDAGVVTPGALYEVNSEDDDPDADTADGVCDTGGPLVDGEPECTLRAAVQQANATPGGDTIVLPFITPGSYHLAAEIEITRDLRITGVPDPGSGDRPVVDADGTDRVFRIDGSGDRRIRVEMFDLVAQDGNANASLTPCGFSDGGGVICNDRGRMSLTRVDVLDGTAASGGGIFNNEGHLSLFDVVVDGNLASDEDEFFPFGDGGGLFTRGGVVHWMGGSVSGNVASGRAGGIWTDDSELTLEQVTIDGNEAFDGDLFGGGGGIYSQTANVITFTDVEVTGNTAGFDGGGGVYLSREDVLTMIGGSVTGNVVLADPGGGFFPDECGGGLFFQESDVSISGTAIEGNYAPLCGGGIFFQNSRLELVGGASVGGNGIDPDDAVNRTDDGGGIFNYRSVLEVEGSAIDGNAADLDGGGIYNRLGQAGGSIVGSTVDGNFAGDEGGGIYNNLDPDFSFLGVTAELTLRDTSVSENGVLGAELTAYGGGIWTDNGILKVLDGSAVDDNIASADGGGIYVGSGTNSVTVDDSTVSGNEAGAGATLVTYHGGGIYQENGTLDVTGGSVVAGNFADDEGGGIWFGGVWMSVVDGDVTGNGVDPADDTNHTEEGGGIYAGAGTVKLEGSSVADNRADAEGGGIWHAGDALRLLGSTVAGNASEESGGGIWLAGDAWLVDSTVDANTAGATGGGVSHGVAGALRVRQSTVSRNMAELGGGLYNTGAPASATNATFSTNTATTNGGGIYTSGDLMLTHVTVTANVVAGGSAAGIYTEAPTTELQSTIVAHNTGPNCDTGGGGAFTTGGHNLENGADPGTCGFDGAGAPGVGADVFAADAMLGPLADNGGPTETHALQGGSPAIDAAPAGPECPPPATDQRGAVRPDGGACDIGAFEATAVPEIAIDDVAVVEGNAGSTPATFTVSLSEASVQVVSVDFATADGTATAPADYAAGGGTVVFAPGHTSEPVTIDVAGDEVDEPDETFTVGLSNPGNAAIADPQGLGSILDDDATVFHTLIVTRGGTGTGSVTSDPPGVVCGADCGEELPEGTVVTLTPAPDPGSVFVGWTGDCGGPGACVVTMESDRVVTATFEPEPQPAPLPAGCNPTEGDICGTDGDDHIVVDASSDPDGDGVVEVHLEDGNDTLCVEESAGLLVVVFAGAGEKHAIVGECGATGPLTSLRQSAGSSVGPAGPSVLEYHGGPGRDVVTGGSGNDVLLGAEGNDLLAGLGGEDVVRGGPGNDRLRGGSGEDRLAGLSGRDIAIGGAGDDVLRGGAGDDVLRGGGGKDKLGGGPGTDVCDGGPGKDTLTGCER